MLKLNTKAKLIAAALSILLIVLISSGITVAYLMTVSGTLENEFEPSRVACAVVENENSPLEGDQVNVGSEKYDVRIKNTGDVTAFIRAKIVFNWKKADGTVYARSPVEGVDYNITFAANTAWTRSSDGFYYHTASVAEGMETGILIKSCSPMEGRAPEGYSLSVEIVASAIQADPERAAEENWGVVVTGGTISSVPTE